MNDTIRSILAILEQDKPPELKIAAAQVLGELAPKEPLVVKGLAGRLGNGEDFLSRHVLAALASIGSAPAIRVLVSELDGRHADLAAHLLGEVVGCAAPVLAETFDDASLEARLRMLGILGRTKGTAVAHVAERALAYPELSRRAGEVLVGVVDGLDKRQTRALKSRLVKALGQEELAPQCVAAMLAVLARVDGAGSRPTLIKHAGPEFPAMVRQAALTALGGIRLTPTQAASLLVLIHEDDDVHVVEPALAALEHVEKWPDDSVTAFRKLLVDRKPRVRSFAARALRSLPHADLVKPLVQLLHGLDAEMAAAAGVALSHNPHAKEPLLRALLQDKDPKRARRTMEPLVRLGASFDTKEIQTLLEKGSKLLLAHDPLGETLLALLVRAQPKKGAAALVDKAIKLRRQKKFADSSALLAFLAASERIDAEGRYQLALSRLLLDAANGGHAANGDAAGDATMGYFSLLVRDGFPVLERLKKESMVSPEDLLRVGQHFTDAVGDERRFGVEVLHHVAEKHGRRRVGEEARLTLRAEGL